MNRQGDTHGFDLVPAHIDNTVQRPSCTRRRRTVALELLEFLRSEQQAEVSAVYEIDVVCPSVIVDETHDGGCGVCFQGVRSLGFFGAILGRTGIEIRNCGGGKVAAIPTWMYVRSWVFGSRLVYRLTGGPRAYIKQMSVWAKRIAGKAGVQKSLASRMTTLSGWSSMLSAMASERWYATPTPVMPEPMIHTSASVVSGPVLPSRASGLASGEECAQKERVGFEDGRPAGLLSIENTFWWRNVDVAIEHTTTGAIDSATGRIVVWDKNSCRLVPTMEYRPISQPK